MDVSKTVLITEVAISGLSMTSTEAVALYSALQRVRADLGQEKFIEACPNLDKLMMLMEQEDVV